MSVTAPETPSPERAPPLSTPASSAAAPRWRNWSGAQQAQPVEIVTPSDEEALRRAIGAAAHLRVVGAGHSFSPLVPTDGTLVSLDRLSGLIEADATTHRARLWAGTRLYDLGPLLHDVGQAMPNLGDIDRQSLGGVISTATHGTGVSLPCIAARATALRLVIACGDVLQLSPERDADLFNAAAVSLGALGVISQVTLQNIPSFRLREHVSVLPLDDVLADLERWKSDNRNFELWAFPYSRQAIVKTLNITDAAPTKAQQGGDSSNGLLKLCSETSRLFPRSTSFLQSLVSRFVTPTERVDYSHRIYPTARDVRFNEMEYHLPIDAGPAALDEVCRSTVKSGTAGFFPIEFRFVAADNYWLSPFQGGARASIALHQYHKQDYRPLFAHAEPILRRYGGRPHWGKLHTVDHRGMRELYPELEKFLRVRAELDPRGKLLNPHLRTLFGITAT